MSRIGSLHALRKVKLWENVLLIIIIRSKVDVPRLCGERISDPGPKSVSQLS
jgi:hypothetical protein